MTESIKKITFSIDKYELEKINNSQFAKLRLYICHDLDNKNGSYISFETMKLVEDTLLGKPIIMKLNKFGTDFEEHEIDVVPVGFIPQIGHNIHYEEIDNRNYLVADAIVWKYYSSSTLDIFKRDAIKGISMEIQVFEEHKREEDGYIQIDNYAYLAVCLLGKRYETGMYKTTAKIVEFSKNKTLDILDKEWTRFINKNEKSNKDNKGNKCNKNNEISSLERLSNRKSSLKRNKKEETENFVKEVQEMSISKKQEFNDVEDFESKEVVDDKELKAVEDDAMKEEMAKEEDKEVKEEQKEEAEENKEEKAEEKEEDYCNSEKMSENDTNFELKYNELVSSFELLKAQMSEKDTAILSMNSEIAFAKEEKENMTKELESLKAYKADVEKSKKSEKIKDTFSTLTNILTKEEIDEWKEKSDKYEDVRSFETDIKAFACDKILKTKNNANVTQFSRMAVNLDATDESDSSEDNLWTRITKRVSK